MRELPRQDNLDVARRISIEHLGTLDPSVQARRCGARIEGGGPLVLDFLGSRLLLGPPDWKPVLEDGREIGLREQVLVLHYVEGTGPVAATGALITFAQVPAGEFYLPAFERRSKNLLVAAFGPDPGLALGPASRMGGEPYPAAGGDLAIRFRAFPLVEVALVFWRGDEEFPPDVSVLFSGNVSSFLSTEDVAVLAGMISVRLLKGG